jgi:hypothetical protein
MAIEISITITDIEKRRLSRTFLIYENVTLSPDDEVIKQCLDECLKEFKGEPEDIKLKAVMVLR